MSEFDEALERGVELFNARRFWDAHEAWERAWLESEGERRIFLQGLIQLAAGFHLVERSRFPGATRLFRAAIEKLRRLPPRFASLHLLPLIDAGLAWGDYAASRAGGADAEAPAAIPRLERDSGE